MKTSQSCSSTQAAFTRLELCACLAAGALLVAVALPLLANTGPRSDQVVCLNNLRQIGNVFHAWAADHRGQYPWRLESWEGGNRNYPLKNNLWFQYFWLSNELRTPKILADPADPRPQVSVATTWGREPSGLQSFLKQNNATSYFLGPDAVWGSPQSVLSGDLHFQQTGTGTCQSGIAPVAVVSTGPSDPPTAGLWKTNSSHGPFGNLLFSDGRVEQTSNPGIRTILGFGPANVPERSNAHFLTP
jgi:hypothetical protein